MRTGIRVSSKRRRARRFWQTSQLKTRFKKRENSAEQAAKGSKTDQDTQKKGEDSPRQVWPRTDLNIGMRKESTRVDMLGPEQMVPARAESATSSCGKIPTITSPGDAGQALADKRS